MEIFVFDSTLAHYVKAFEIRKNILCRIGVDTEKWWLAEI